MDKWGKRLLLVVITVLLIILIFNKLFSEFWVILRYTLSTISILAGSMLIGFYRKGLDWDGIKYRLNYYINMYFLKRKLNKIQFGFGIDSSKKSPSVFLIGIVLVVSGLFALVK